MKHLAVALLVAFLSIAAFPANKGLVTDDANILTVAEEAALEQKLRAFEQQTSVELAVVTVTSLDGMSIDEYRVKLFEAWKIGKKGKDNGVLMIFAPNEPPTGKVGIEVGYGLEGILPDGMTGAIIREQIRPGWRSAHRADGIIAGVDAIIARLSAPPVKAESAVTVSAPPNDAAESWWVLVALILIGVALIVFFMVRRARRRSYTPPVIGSQAWNRYFSDDQVPPSQLLTPRRATPYVSPRRAIIVSAPAPTHSYSYDSSPSYSSSDSSSSSSSSFDFGGGSSGGAGASSDL
jgi:uncharacterized membrane protein YgcG